LGIVEEEADETLYWFEILMEINPELKEKIETLYKKMYEILSIIVTSKKTARKKR